MAEHSVYYGELTNIFGELDHHDKVIMESENDVVSYQKSAQWQRVHIFFVGLDGNFEQVCGKILRKDPILELEECYALVCCEFFLCTTMIGERKKTKASTMVTWNWSNQNGPPQNPPKITNGVDRSTYKCTHCNQICHTKSYYFELVGYLEWWDPSHNSQKKNSKKTYNVVFF